MLHPRDNELIAEAVGRAEERTSGEIVVVVVPASAGYVAPMWALSAFGAALGAFLHDALSAIPSLPSLLQLATPWVLGGALVGVAVAMPGWLRVRLVPRAEREAIVTRAAQAAFHREGVGRARDGVGVLVYASVLERRVRIAAGRGIDAHVSAEQWDALAREAERGIAAGAPGEALRRLVERVGELLATHAPRAELPPHMRTRLS